MNIVASICKLKLSQVKKIKLKLRKKQSPLQLGQGRKLKLNGDHIDFVHELIIKQKPLKPYSITDIRFKLIKNFSVFKDNPPSLATIKKLLKMARISRKRFSFIKFERNFESSKSERYDTAISTVNHIQNQKTIIYIDETGIKKNMMPLYGLSKISTKCQIPSAPKSKNFSILTAISEDDIIGFQIIEGSVKGCDFGCFLLNLIRNSLYFRDSYRNYVFFMDNASIHKAKELHELLKFIKIQYNAPYSPFLNPIEQLFSLFKKNYRNYQTDSQDLFIENVVKAFNNIEISSIRNIIVHSYKYLLLSLEKNDV